MTYFLKLLSKSLYYYAALCTSSGVVKCRKQFILLTLQLGSQTLYKRLDANHDDLSKYIFDDGQKKEFSISAVGDFGEMKNTKSRRVGRYALEPKAVCRFSQQ